MRSFSEVLIVALVLGLGLGLGGTASAQTTCTGLCLQQTTCTGNATTSVSGVVYAPNGTDPLPNVTVYVPNAPVDAFPAGVSCPISGSPPSGSPLVGTITDVNGKFSLVDMPVGQYIPLVIVSGRWRRQLVIPITTACTNTALPPTFAVMPQNQNQGDIPKIAIATGSVDQVECVLRKVGINDSEFTDPSETGRINFYTGSAVSGSAIDSKTPTQASLMENYSTLQNYDVLMLPCQGTPTGDVVAGALGTQELANFIAFANAGGRVYSSHYSYAWMFNNPPFNSVANWDPSLDTNQNQLATGSATVNTSFTAGQTLSTWLQDVGSSTSPGQMDLDTLRIDQTGVIAPTQSWLTLNQSMGGVANPVMQFVFDTPIGATNQCGRVLYNEYHVENGSSSPTTYFPTECSAGAMTPQEKLLEYMLFELTDEGGQPSLAPTSQDFGPEAVTYPSAPQTFTWTNNSSFAAQVSSTAITGTNYGDFTVATNNCGAVAAGTSCTITVVFTPSVLGAESATLNVLSAGMTLTATLTGTGVPGFTLTPASLSFGNQDVGFASAPQTLTLTSNASGPLAVPAFVTTPAGEYAVNQAACGSSLAALGSCQIGVTFKPAATGAQTGTFAVNPNNLTGTNSLLYSGVSATLSGTGVDFTISLNPTAGSVAAGDGTTTIATLTPIAGFSAPLFVSCKVAAGATAAMCSLSSATLTPAATTVVSIGTTSQYTVIGYSGFGGRGLLWLVAAASGWLLWRRRRSGRAFLPHLKFEMWGTRGLLLALLAAMGLGLTSCTGKLPAENGAWTAPGNYTVTVTATDGQLSHSATYSLTVR
jgi:hypothetical protein